MKVLSMVLFVCVLFHSSGVKAAQDYSPLFEVEVVGSGEPVLLIPGFTSDSRVWDGIIHQLSIHHQVHKFSLAGFGSTKPVQDPSLKRTKNALLDYIKSHRLQQPVIIGHSLGGFMGLWLEVSEPALIGPVISVDGLPFIGPVFTRDASTTAEQLKSQAGYMKLFYSGLDADGMEQMAAQGMSVQVTDETHQAVVLEMSRLSDPATAGDAIHTLMITDLRAELKAADSPILLLGASGGFSDETSKKMAENLYQNQLKNAPNALVKMNTQSRHFIMYDAPTSLSQQVLQFLQTSL